MVNIVIQISKYIIIILMAAYTFSCFSIFTRNYEDEEKRVLIRQNVLMFLLQFTAFGAMYLATDDIRIACHGSSPAFSGAGIKRCRRASGRIPALPAYETPCLIAT